MEVFCLTTGRVRGKRSARGPRRYLPGGWSPETLPVNVFAVSHPSGLCLFDAGQSARAASAGYLPRWHPFLRLASFELGPGDEAAAQLAARGIEPSVVRWVVLSHLHTDHVGGLAPFRGAEVVVSRVEWERARGLAGRLRGYVPRHWPPGLEPRVVDFDGPPLPPFPASLDLAGDGSLVLVPTPGHTPGHLSLLVRGGGRSYLLGGDVCHSAAELAPGLARFCAEQDVVFLAAHDPLAAELAGGR